MIYTIAMTLDIQNDQTAEFYEDGNKYGVGLHNEGTSETVRKEFSDIKTGLAVYQKIVEAFVTGCYSFADRASWLA